MQDGFVSDSVGTEQPLRLGYLQRRGFHRARAPFAPAFPVAASVGPAPPLCRGNLARLPANIDDGRRFRMPRAAFTTEGMLRLGFHRHRAAFARDDEREALVQAAPVSASIGAEQPLHTGSSKRSTSSLLSLGFHRHRAAFALRGASRLAHPSWPVSASIGAEQPLHRSCCQRAISLTCEVVCERFGEGGYSAASTS